MHNSIISEITGANGANIKLGRTFTCMFFIIYINCKFWFHLEIPQDFQDQACFLIG